MKTWLTLNGSTRSETSPETIATLKRKGWTEIVEPTHEPTESESLASRRAAMAADFDTLPVAVQAAFWTTRVSAESAMDRGRFDIARALIEAQAVPPELEATKAAILAHFPTV